jgi:hypothetical protein
VDGNTLLVAIREVDNCLNALEQQSKMSYVPELLVALMPCRGLKQAARSQAPRAARRKLSATSTRSDGPVRTV